MVLKINKYEPTADFAKRYLEDAKDFLDRVETLRKIDLINV
jgi:hypothetical protein